MHGGPTLNIHNPLSLKEYAKNIDRYRGVSISNSWSEHHVKKLDLFSPFSSSDRTFAALPFIDELTQTGRIIICLNYPGSSIHGNNWYDPEYSNLISCNKSGDDGKYYQLALMDNIQQQIIDLISEFEKRHGKRLSAQYFGHSLGDRLVL